MKLIGHIRRFGLPTLRNLVGETLLKAVEGCAPSEQESQLAEILHLRFGYNILEVKEIRKALIDSLSEPEGKELARLAGVSAPTHIQRSQLLTKHFKSYNLQKSEQLVSFFDLPQTYIYCVKPDEREAIEVLSIQGDEEVRLKPYLHPYQKVLKDDISKRLKAGSVRFMIQMPTGAGKTYTALEVIVDSMRSPGSTSFVVWIVDSNELAEQALESFKALWKMKGDRPLAIGRLFNKFCPSFSECRNGGVVFSSFDKVNSILTDATHPDRVKLRNLLDRTHLLIVDEAHASIARTYRLCIEAFSDNSSVQVIGLTATPGRPSPEESAELSQVFSNNLIGLKDLDGHLIEDPIHYLQHNKYLATLECELLETGISVIDSDEHSICRQLALNSNRNSKIVDQIQIAHQSQESTAVFGCTLDHVFALKVMCSKRLIPCEIIVGETPQNERLEILRRFKDRQFFILLNLDILSTGIDIPKLQKLILTRPI
ncbi:MAG: DEAD/DEAH box helicase, partial [Proteobacteria bacterium]|nr:DEAD/DEAH box helicase [Pseudomonadota bacterium]